MLKKQLGREYWHASVRVCIVIGHALIRAIILGTLCRLITDLIIKTLQLNTCLTTQIFLLVFIYSTIAFFKRRNLFVEMKK